MFMRPVDRSRNCFLMKLERKQFSLSRHSREVRAEKKLGRFCVGSNFRWSHISQKQFWVWNWSVEKFWMESEVIFVWGRSHQQFWVVSEWEEMFGTVGVGSNFALSEIRKQLLIESATEVMLEVLEIVSCGVRRNFKWSRKQFWVESESEVSLGSVGDKSSYWWSRSRQQFWVESKSEAILSRVEVISSWVRVRSTFRVESESGTILGGVGFGNNFW